MRADHVPQNVPPASVTIGKCPCVQTSTTVADGIHVDNTCLKL